MFDARLAFCVSRIHQLEHPISPSGGSVEAQSPGLSIYLQRKKGRRWGPWGPRPNNHRSVFAEYSLRRTKP